MPDPTSNETTPPEPSIDLSALQGFTFGPAWSDAGAPAQRYADAEGREDRGPRGDRRGPGGRGSGPAPDRRGFRRPTGPGGRPDAPGGRPEGGGGGGPRRDERPQGGPRRDDGGQRGPRRDGPGDRRPPLFRPTVEVVFYPEDEVFKVLTKAMRQSARTYELFSLARLFLDKAERLVAVIRPRADSGSNLLYLSAPDGLPFETEDEAISHVLERHLEAFFTTEEVEVDPPKGNFPCVMKCGMTGELLGPPNYHRHPAILQEHYARRLSGRTSFEGFQRRLETLRDPESVQLWLDGMRKVTRYTLKAAEGEEAKSFESLESAKFFLTTHAKATLVKTVPFIRLHGREIEKIPVGGNVRSSIDALLDQQRRFPLDTANHLRGRLRKLQFCVYKRGSKGVSYVCAVKRKFRLPNQTFSISLQRLIEHIEAHPGIHAATLPQEILGIDPALLKPEAAEATEGEEAARAGDQPVAETPEQGEATAVVTEEIAVPADAADPAEPAAGEELAPAEACAEPIADSSEVPAEVAEAEAEVPAEAVPEAAAETAPEVPAAEEAAAAPLASLTGEQKLLLAQLRRDLRWLVSEGYVVELEDATLYAPPPRSPAEAAHAEAEDESAADTEAATEPEPEAEPEPVAESASTEPAVEAAASEGEETPEAAVAQAPAEASVEAPVEAFASPAESESPEAESEAPKAGPQG